MFARSRQLLATLAFALDAALLYASWLTAYALRFYGLGIESPLGIPPFSIYLWSGAVLTLVALLILRSLRVYRSARTARLSRELFLITQATALTTLLAGVGSYFAKGELSRFAVGLFFGLATLSLCGSRLAARLVLRELRRHGHNLRHVLVVGTGEHARGLIEKIHRHADFGLVIEGLVSAGAGEVGTVRWGHPVLGTVGELPRLVEQAGAELVYLALARQEHEAEEQALTALGDSTASVRLVPDLSLAFRLNPSVEDFDGTPVVLVTESPELGWNAALKRGFDLAASFLGLILLAPVLLLVAVLIRLDSPGPVFYRQERVGINGRRFLMIKFRSMRADAEAAGRPQWTTADDPRRTRLGQALRRLSIDELPQLWNVLVGDMSLVGPRPERPMYVDQFRASIPRYMLRHHVKSGMTGWAQVNGLRGDTPLERRIEYDLHYVKNWSLGFDVKILALTVVRVFRDASAY
jgi:Undecaprenyl-phosphate glucose phosphotransferase